MSWWTYTLSLEHFFYCKLHCCYVLYIYLFLEVSPVGQGHPLPPALPRAAALTVTRCPFREDVSRSSMLCHGFCTVLDASRRGKTQSELLLLTVLYIGDCCCDNERFSTARVEVDNLAALFPRTVKCVLLPALIPPCTFFFVLSKTTTSVSWMQDWPVSLKRLF